MTSSEEQRYIQAREEMVVVQLEGRGVTDEEVLAAMRKMPRHLFVEPSLRAEAYTDKALFIAPKAVLLRPVITAVMLEQLRLGPNDKVFELGTGTGYQTALLAELSGTVYTTEIDPTLGEKANKLITELGFRNVLYRNADGLAGWSQRAPFDAIVLTAAVREIPWELIKQLDDNGRMIFPLIEEQTSLVLLEKRGGEVTSSDLGEVDIAPVLTPTVDVEH